MGIAGGFGARLRALFGGKAVERELDEEIGFHVARETERNIALGLPADEARRQALASFGGVAQAREAHREVRGVPWLTEFMGDARYACRTLRRSPVFAFATVLTLALGIGANAAIFSAVNAVVLRPLPFPDPGRLVMVWEKNPEKGWYQQVVAPANYLDWKDQVGAFKDVAAYNGGNGSRTLTAEGAPQLLTSVNVTGNFFSVLGVPAELGRTLRPEETWASGTHVAVLSHKAWVNRFGGARGIVGRTVQLDGAPVQIVGVMPDGFGFPSADLDVWVPFEWNPSDRTQVWFRRAHWPRAIARLKPGVTLEQADAELQQVAERLKRQYPETNRVMGAGLTPLHQFLVGTTRRPLLVLLAAVSLLLVIACANVGNLLLVQAAGRERETALRLALGAGRSRVIRQALAESVVLSLLGGAAGLGLGWVGTRVLQALQPAGMLRVEHFGMDLRVLGYLVAITLVSGLLFGIAPALWNGRRAPAEALKEGGRGGGEAPRARRWSEGLVVSEVAVALLLTLGAGLLVRSFMRLQRVNAGFDASGVLSALIALPESRYDTLPKATLFFEQLVERARAIPGVTEVGLGSSEPLTNGPWTSDFVIAGRPADQFGSEVMHREIDPGYFRAMRVALLRGRTFTDADRAGGERVTVINEPLTRQYFQGQDPIGQRIAFDRLPDSSSVWWTIVGVVQGERQKQLSIEPGIEAYFPIAQDPRTGLFLFLRTAGDPNTLAPGVRHVVGDLDPALAIQSLHTMAEVRSQSVATDRFLTTLMLMFAGVGMLLAIVGVYGVIAQLALRRTREMGIRMALGAQLGEVRWMVVRHGLRLVGTGLVIGTVAALIATRGMRALLYEVAPADPVTFVAVPLALALTGLLASWLPAVQASRVDPATALRSD